MMPSGEGSSRPPRHAWKRNPVFKFLASLRLAVVLLAALIAMSIVGTIAESKFDADTARIWIYEAPWFQFWLVLLAANLVCSTLTRWPWKRHHTGFLLTHLGIIVVLAGAMIGHWFGVEGTMTLFKGEPPDNALVLQSRQITVRDSDSKSAVMLRLGRSPLRVGAAPTEIWVTPAGWRISAVASSARLLGMFLPSPSPAGRPAVRVRLRTDTMNQTVDQWLLAGDKDHGRLDLGLITVDLLEGDAHAPSAGAKNRAVIRVKPDGSLLADVITGARTVSSPITAGAPLPTGWLDWTIEAVQVLPSAAPGFRFEPLAEEQSTPAGQPLLDGVLVRASRGETSMEQWVAAGWRVSLPTGALPIEILYGWEIFRLPFGLSLTDFVVERNEGTDDPASFRSDLAMVLPDGTVAATGSCSMNRPANYPSSWWRSMTGLTYKISQASWNPNDLDQSSVQILRDPGWLAKWTGSLILCAGLVTMFTIRKRPAANPR